MQCRLLTRLVLTGGGARLQDADLAALLHALPALQHLDLSGCTALTGAAFVQLQQRQQQQLRQQQPGAPVAASAAALGSSASVVRSIQPVLRMLRLEGCSQLSSAACEAVADVCPDLEVLSLRQCSRVTADASAWVLRRCENLRQLLLAGTSALCCYGVAADRDAQWCKRKLLTLVELPLEAMQWGAAWRALLYSLCANDAKLVYRQ
jgi:hypothetical protein